MSYCEDADGSKYYFGEHRCYYCNRPGWIYLRLPVLDDSLAFICNNCRREQLEMSTRMSKWTPLHVRYAITEFVITSKEHADRFLYQLKIEGLIEELTESLVLKRLSGDDWP